MATFIKVVPKNWLSYLVGVLVHLPLPAPLSTWSIQWFAERYNINIEEAEKPLEDYKSIGDFFTRKLKPGVRPIAESKVVHPADAEITIRGTVTGDTLIQAKEMNYSLTRLLRDERALEIFSGGVYMTYYLCPTDYHRVHSPVKGRITRVTHVPGYLWPVNNWSVKNIDRLFANNERVIVWIETDDGPVALVMVGATNVGKMTMSFDKSIVTNQKLIDPRVYEKNYELPLALDKGDEIGIFNMGSTVIMVYSSGVLNQQPSLGKVKMGESI